MFGYLLGPSKDTGWDRDEGIVGVGGTEDMNMHSDTGLVFLLSLFSKIYYFRMLSELRGGITISCLELGEGKIRFYGSFMEELVLNSMQKCWQGFFF